MSHEITCKPWETMGVHIFMLSKQNYLSLIKDYSIKFPRVKQTEVLLANHLIKGHKIVFAECGLPKKIMSNVGADFVLETFQEFCRG